MISEHPSFPWPEQQDLKLWRYMDLSKFMSLLQSKTLWMSRADTLGDPLEGSITRAMKDKFVEEMKSHPVDSETLSKVFREHAYNSYISCWHASDYESAAMWKLYSQSSDAVCIQSTFSSVAESLPPSMYGARVNYIDYDIGGFDIRNLFNFIMHKRRSFEHEREYRFFALAWPDKNVGGEHFQFLRGGGLAWPIEPSELIEAVYVSPTAQDWFLDVVARAAKDHSLSAPVSRSSLLRDPIF